MTSKDLEVLKRFYGALATANVAELTAALDPRFVVKAAAGLPAGLGGIYTGRDAALRNLWGRVAQIFDVKPIPVDFSVVDGGEFFVTGHYTGRSRSTGNSFTADFVHRIRMQDGLLTHLAQCTDTQQWCAVDSFPSAPETAGRSSLRD